MKNQLKELSNPEEFQSPIDISDVDVDVLMLMLESMVTIRKTEQQLALGRKNGLIGGPVHLGAGQEAIAIATIASNIAGILPIPPLEDLRKAIVFLSSRNLI